MRLLFVKLKHIGDSFLLTPTLTAVRASYPAAEIWVMVRKGCEGIMTGCPAIDKLLTGAAPEAAKRSRSNWWREWQMVFELRRRRFDYAFELSDGGRGRWISCLSRAKIRCTNGTGRPLNWWWRRQFNFVSQFDGRDCHRAEKDFFTVNDCLPIGRQVPPLMFDHARAEIWEPTPAAGDYAVMHPGTRWVRKQWPEAKWWEVGQQLLARVGHLVISVGPDPAEIKLAATLAASLGPRAISTEGQLSWAQLAGVLYGANLFVGVDTAAMHLAAACQCPTVAIFGPSRVSAWRPFRVPHRVLTPPGAEAVTDDSDRARLETSRVGAAEVVAACLELLAAPRSAG
jgi:heptosyltransferase-3